MKKILLLPLLLALMCTFSTTNLEAKDHRFFNFDFSINNDGWVGDFSDYPVGDETFFELTWAWKPLPVPLLVGNKTFTQGLYLSGNNHSDDLFMFFKRKIGTLKPNTEYELTFQVTIQDNIPTNLIGIGGSPGESVFFKVGASTQEPRNIVDYNHYYRLNVDKGNQSQGGRNAIVVGTLANPLVDPNDRTYEPLTYRNSMPLKVKSDKNGQVWLFIGTDSGFEGPTHYYIGKISVNALKKGKCPSY